MKITVRQLRRIIQESLGVPSEAAGLAACTDYGSPSAVIYSPEALVQAAREESGNWEHVGDIADSLKFRKVVKGYIRLLKIKHPCRSAWMVSSAAGPGLGKVVYGLGYALSPSGLIMPDRLSVSVPAEAGWTKAAKAGRKRYPLDDINAEPEDRLTPDDPTDDCTLQQDLAHGGPDPILDYAYEAEGWEEGMLSELQERHSLAMQEVLGIDADETEKRIKKALYEAAEDFFFNLL